MIKYPISYSFLWKEGPLVPAGLSQFCKLCSAKNLFNATIYPWRVEKLILTFAVSKNYKMFNAPLKMIRVSQLLLLLLAGSVTFFSCDNTKPASAEAKQRFESIIPRPV